MLRYMSCGANFRSIGDSQLKYSKTSVWRYIWEAVDFIYYNHERYIRWPQTHEELQQLSLLYNTEKYGHRPNVVGAVDCMHVLTKKPDYNWQEEAYVNRKSSHSINTMVILT